MAEIILKRIYEEYSEDDGYRILVDRLWPRGITKEKARIDEWAKLISTTNELRKSYHSGKIELEEFSMKYREEMENNPEVLRFIDLVKSKLAMGNVTLLTSAKNIEVSHLPVIKEYINEQ